MIFAFLRFSLLNNQSFVLCCTLAVPITSRSCVLFPFFLLSFLVIFRSFQRRDRGRGVTEEIPRAARRCVTARERADFGAGESADCRESRKRMVPLGEECRRRTADKKQVVRLSPRHLFRFQKVACGRKVLGAYQDRYGERTGCSAGADEDVRHITALQYTRDACCLQLAFDQVGLEGIPTNC